MASLVTFQAATECSNVVKQLLQQWLTSLYALNVVKVKHFLAHPPSKPFAQVIIDQTGNRRSEDGKVERAPRNKQQKHMFVVSTDVFCR